MKEDFKINRTVDVFFPIIFRNAYHLKYCHPQRYYLHKKIYKM